MSITGVPQIILLFAIYSFIGWILEVIYRSFNSRKFVNAGFLYGVFIPIYGTGALTLVLLNSIIADTNIAVKFTVFTLTLTAIEYITGILSEKIFNLTLWDYSENKFNINGKVCLSFSASWGIMSLIFTEYIHPFAVSVIYHIPDEILKTTAVVFSLYLLTDTTLSAINLNRFRRKIAWLYSEYLTLSNHEMDSIMLKFRRILGAFPNLNKYLDFNIREGVKKRIDEIIKEIKEKPFAIINGRKPDREEYNSIVKDILDNKEFCRLADYYHHNSSILDHAKIVSWISYSLCKYLNLDYRSAARGALLHDFFLYDWRNHDVPDLAKEKFHGIEHPKIALANSQKHFTLNKVEKDIIIKHMWPLTLVPPAYRESFIVTFVDKYTASREFVENLPDLIKPIKELKRTNR